MSNFIKKWTSSLLALLFTMVCFGQNVKVTHYPYLDNQAINSILVDEFNNKWVGTNDAIYKVENKNEAPDLMYETGAYSSVVDNYGNLWFGLVNCILLDYYKKNSYPLSNDNQKILNNIVVSDEEVLVSTTKEVWDFDFITVNDQLLKMQGKVYNEHSGIDRVNFIYEDNNAKKWIGTEDGIYTINALNETIQKGNIQASSYTINNNSMWVAGSDGIWEYENMKKWREHKEFYTNSQHRIAAMVFDQKNKLWMLSDQITYCDGPSCKEVGGDQGFNSTHGTCIAVDKSNTIWVGTAGKGLFSVEVEGEIEEEFLEVVMDKTQEELAEERDLKRRFDYMGDASIANLVVLIDVSSSMAELDKFPRLNTSLQAILERMRPKDEVSIITFSQQARIILEPTACTQNKEIGILLDSLNVRGTSNVSNGLLKASSFIRRIYVEGKNNRIILATDGRFKIDKETINLIKENNKKGIALTVFDFGKQENTELKRLAEKGGGTYQLIPPGASDLFDILEQQVKGIQ